MPASLSYKAIFLWSIIGVFGLFFFLTQSIAYAALADDGGAPSTAMTNPPVQKFVPLAGIPGFTGSETLEGLAQALYKLAIIVGALLAVLRITWAGFLYMSSDSIGGKSEATENIRSSLLGLLILLSAVLIMRTISGNVNLDFLAAGNKDTQLNISAPQPAIVAGVTDAPAKINQKEGCAQTSGTCNSGYTLTFLSDRTQCYKSDSVPSYSGSVFQPVTQDACAYAGVGDSIIKNGGSLYGASYTTLGKMTEALKTASADATEQKAVDALTAEQVRQKYMEKILTPACAAQTGNNPQTSVEIMGSGVPLCDGRTWGGYFSCGGGSASTNDSAAGFICSTTPQPQ